MSEQLEQLKQFLVAKVIPVIAAAITTWVFASSHVLNLFGVTEGETVAIIVQALTFGVTYVVSWLTVHHILRGRYEKGAGV